MNEQIQELAEQAGFENGHQDRNGNSLSYELEKFAELIVKECVSIAYQNDTAKFTRDGYRIGLDIQKHFGVEE